MIKTVSSIVASMKSFIRGKNSTADLSEGTILNDIVILAPSQELGKLYEELQTTSEGQSIETSNDNATDKLASNVALLRLSARTAKGVVTFFSFDEPTADILIPAGTIVETYSSVGGGVIQFVTTAAVTMYKNLASLYLNVTSNLYEITATIEAIRAGELGNVGPQSINQLNTTILGINGCFNSEATSGGSDFEDTESLKLRIASKIRGTNIGTADGFLSATLTYPGVEDAVVVGGAATGRDELGAVDIYVRGKNSVQAQDAFVSYGTYPDLVFSHQPVIPTETITVVASSGPLSNIYYELVQDTGSFGGSIEGQDAINWLIPVTASSGSLAVNYSYNSLIYDLQNFFNSQDRAVQNTNLLVKWASETLIIIACSIKVSPGYDSEVVTSEIETELAAFFNTLQIGAEILQADVVEIILAVPGVEDLLLPLTTFQSSDGSILPDTFNNLQLPSKAYAVLSTLTINVVS